MLNKYNAEIVIISTSLIDNSNINKLVDDDI